MPYRPTDKWYAAMTKLGTVSPVFVIVIDQCPFNFSSAPIRPKIAGGSDWNSSGQLLAGVLEVTSQLGARLQQPEGNLTLDDLSFTLTDIGGLLNRWIATELAATRIYQRQVTLHMGTADLAEDEFETFFSGKLEDVKLAANGGAYQFRAFSRAREWEKEIMLSDFPSTEGSVKTGDSSSPFTVFTGNSDLSSEDDAYNGFILKWSKGANEGTEQTISDYTGSTRTITLTSGPSNQIDKGDEFTIYNFVELVGNPADIFVRVLVNDFALAGAIQADYPLVSVTGTPTGLSYSLADLDETQIQTERDLWLSGTEFRMKWRDKEKAIDWMKSQLFGVLGCRAFFAPSGLIQFQMTRPQVPPTLPFEVTDQAVIGVPDWTRDHSGIVNEVWVWGDWNPATDEYQILVKVETSDARYTKATIGITNRIEIKSRGLATSSNGVSLAQSIASRLLARFGMGGAEIVQADGGWELGLLQPGERVLLTHSQLPSLFSATLGKSGESFEVTRNSPRPSDGRATLQLTSWYAPGTPMFMAPSTVSSDYDTASKEDRQYGYIATEGGYFSDGRPPYTVI